MHCCCELPPKSCSNSEFFIPGTEIAPEFLGAFFILIGGGFADASLEGFDVAFGTRFSFKPQENPADCTLVVDLQVRTVLHCTAVLTFPPVLRFHHGGRLFCQLLLLVVVVALLSTLLVGICFFLWQFHVENVPPLFAIRESCKCLLQSPVRLCNAAAT
jgi:hypothetical protein